MPSSPLVPGDAINSVSAVSIATMPIPIFFVSAFLFGILMPFFPVKSPGIPITLGNAPQFALTSNTFRGAQNRKEQVSSKFPFVMNAPNRLRASRQIC